MFPKINLALISKSTYTIAKRTLPYRFLIDIKNSTFPEQCYDINSQIVMHKNFPVRMRATVLLILTSSSH
jgi:hypothetical protein